MEQNKFFAIKQIYLKKMDTFSYIIGDIASKKCILIDPAFETNRILHEVDHLGYKSVTHLINTHYHSDHTAGNAAIINKTSAKLCIHKQDSNKLCKILNSAFSRVIGGKGSPKPDILLEDQTVIKIGEISLKVIHTPGHTPGSICLYLTGNIFTGDTLFVESVGRTDLPGGSSKQLLRSIKEKLYTLPEKTIVWPGHDYGPNPHSTVEHEKKNNLFTL